MAETKTAQKSHFFLGVILVVLSFAAVAALIQVKHPRLQRMPGHINNNTSSKMCINGVCTICKNDVCTTLNGGRKTKQGHKKSSTGLIESISKLDK